MKSLKSALLVLPLLWLLTACSANPPEHPFLPWEITQNEDGSISVFGIHLGEDSLLDIRYRLDKRAELAVFESPDGERALEAYFGKLMIGPFEAQLVAVAETSQARIEALIQGGPRPEPQPSGAWRFELSYDAIHEAQHFPVRSISYVPTARYEEELVTRRFGAPPRETVDPRDGTRFWLYPEKGLLISFDRRGKNLFQYINPAEFELLERTVDFNRGGPTAIPPDTED